PFLEPPRSRAKQAITAPPQSASSVNDNSEAGTGPDNNVNPAQSLTLKLQALMEAHKEAGTAEQLYVLPRTGEQQQGDRQTCSSRLQKNVGVVRSQGTATPQSQKNNVTPAAQRNGKALINNNGK